MQGFVEIRPPEDDASEPLLDLTAQESEGDEQQANANQQKRGVKRIAGNSLVDGDPLKSDADHSECQQSRQQHIGEEADESVQQDEAVILQQNEQGKWDTRMMQQQLARPRMQRLIGPEVDEGH